MDFEKVIINLQKTRTEFMYLIKCIFEYSKDVETSKIDVCLKNVQGATFHPNQDKCLKNIPLDPLSHQFIVIWKVKIEERTPITGKLVISQNQRVIQEKSFIFDLNENESYKRAIDL